MNKATEIAERYDIDLGDAILLEGFDEAIISIAESFNGVIVVYSAELIIKVLMDVGMSNDDAIDYYDNNILYTYFGEQSPVFIYDI